MDNLNEFQADLQQDLDAENRHEQDSPAYHLEEIRRISQSLTEQCKELQALIDKPAFTFDENGKMIF